jgi:hypothetical protein
MSRWSTYPYSFDFLTVIMAGRYSTVNLLMSKTKRKRKKRRGTPNIIYSSCCHGPHWLNDMIYSRFQYKRMTEISSMIRRIIN